MSGRICFKPGTIVKVSCTWLPKEIEGEVIRVIAGEVMIVHTENGFFCIGSRSLNSCKEVKDVA